ncbi:hypothetical protein [Methylomonas methanica]|uniref:Uncharacterized protein n=1 Tax=Methylomonas methanica (strain DSM 25384 / MC09) TaxID=857087 RepID=G0A7E4_METMM|nr:hypothetical protein [Methylomonas methanica]AEG00614.1 hypothetical protein Metme_2210 [Methylomonas methanica MC09]
MDYIFRLPQPVRPKPTHRNFNIFPGHRHYIELPDNTGHDLANPDYAQQIGLVGAYRLELNASKIEAIDTSLNPMQCFIWDVDLLTPRMRQALRVYTDRAPATDYNQLTMLDISMATPDVRLIESLPTLTISPHFQLEWHTPAHASQLGIVQLVESTRTLQQANGNTVVLLDTEVDSNGPVLLLEDTLDRAVIKPVCGFQSQGERKRFEFSHTVSQTIPTELNGVATVSVSVLEKYTLYFMQNANPEQADRYIWVPVHLPVVWGWSMRVQQRYDGIWDIFRKKLIMPTPSTEAPALPRWQRNSLACRGTAQI